MLRAKSKQTTQTSAPQPRPASGTTTHPDRSPDTPLAPSLHFEPRRLLSGWPSTQLTIIRLRFQNPDVYVSERHGPCTVASVDAKPLSLVPVPNPINAHAQHHCLQSLSQTTPCLAVARQTALQELRHCFSVTCAQNRTPKIIPCNTVFSFSFREILGMQRFWESGRSTPRVIKRQARDNGRGVLTGTAFRTRANKPSFEQGSWRRTRCSGTKRANGQT